MCRQDGRVWDHHGNNNIIIGHHTGVHSRFGQEDDVCYIDNIYGATVDDATAAIVWSIPMEDWAQCPPT